MAAPSDPEKYSLDDMMDRLKNQPDEEPIENGELVTRTDGSQAIRVRKRKRRSNQPHKEEIKKSNRARMVQVSAALIFVLLLIFAAGAAIIYANSSPFRNELTENITRSSGANVELTQFRMNPASANAGQLILTWPDDNVLESLSLRNIRAKISPSAFFGKTMTGEEASAGEGTLTLRLPGNPSSNASNLEKDGTPPVRFGVYTLPKLHMRLGNANAPLARINNTEASFTPSNVNGRPQLLLNRGDVIIPGWPKLRLDRSHIEFRGNEIDIIGLRLRHASDSRRTFELGGILTPFSLKGPSSLAVHVDSYLLSGIVGEALGKRFSGRIDTDTTAQSSHLAISPGSDPTPSLTIAFRSSIPTFFEVSGFPFLFGLAQTLEDDWFSHPSFDAEVTGTIRRSAGNVSLSDLNFENKGRMALRGSLNMDANKRLSGTLEVGVAVAMIGASGNPRLQNLFGPPENGFRWVSLKPGGTADSPTDNFKALFNAASPSVSPDSTSEIPSFEELTAPE